jgi:hypothetical protein
MWVVVQFLDLFSVDSLVAKISFSDRLLELANWLPTK